MLRGFILFAKLLLNLNFGFTKAYDALIIIKNLR